jgi:hypothetical protein
MKDFLVNNRDVITNVLGALPATAVAGYQTYEAMQGQSGNGTTIALACIMAMVSYFTGKGGNAR